MVCGPAGCGKTEFLNLLIKYMIKEENLHKIDDN